MVAVSGVMPRGYAAAGKVTVDGDTAYVNARVFPRNRAISGELANAIARVVAQEGWSFDELHTEEGRLDDVFRSITMPDTAKSGA